MTEEKPKTEWQKCPGCNGFIPKTWDNHKKCGWNVIETQKTIKTTIEKPVSVSSEIKSAFTTEDFINQLRPLINGLLDLIDEYENRDNKK